jgi:hypothetical protein
VDAIDAGKLIAFVTDPSLSPGGSGTSAEYRQLVTRYLAEADFRRTVDDILEGAGAVVTDAAEDLGLVVCVDQESPWCWPARSAQLPWNREGLSADERAPRMIVIPALLAYLAPSAADFEDRLTPEDVRVVSVRELDQFIRDFAEHQEYNQPDPVGPNKPIWWYWRQRSADAAVSDRIQRTTTTYWVHDVLQFLHGLRLLTQTSGSSAANAVYRPRRRLLAHYRDLLVDDLYEALHQFATSRHTTTTFSTTEEA